MLRALVGLASCFADTHSCLSGCADSVNQGIIRLTTCPRLLFLCFCCFGTEMGKLTGAPEIYVGEKKTEKEGREICNDKCFLL